MDDQGLATLSGFAEGAEKALLNLQNIQIMKYKLGQEKEMHDLDVRGKKIEIQKAEMLYGPEELKDQKEIFDAQLKIKKIHFNMAAIAMAKAEKENKDKYTTYTNQLSTLAQFVDLKEMGLVDPNTIDQKKVIENKVARGEALLPGEQKLYEDNINKSKPTQWDLQKEARTTVNAMLQNNDELQGKVFNNPAMLTELIDQEVSRLQGKYMGSTEKIGQPSQKAPGPSIQLPPEVKTTTQAVDYLMQKHSMTKEQAVKWIKEQ